MFSVLKEAKLPDKLGQIKLSEGTVQISHRPVWTILVAWIRKTACRLCLHASLMTCIHVYLPWSLNACFKSYENHFRVFSDVFVEQLSFLWVQVISQSEAPVIRLDRLTWVAMASKLDGGLPLENQGELKRKLRIQQADRQTDRCLIARAAQTAVEHHCRVLGLMEGWWGNITSVAGGLGGGNAAAALANY